MGFDLWVFLKFDFWEFLNFWVLQSKYATDDITVEKKRKIANPRMPTAATGGRPIRQAFAVVNAAPDLAPASGPPSTAGSDGPVFEFTKEDVEALLGEKLKTKNKFNTKVRC